MNKHCIYIIIRRWKNSLLVRLHDTRGRKRLLLKSSDYDLSLLSLTILTAACSHCKLTLTNRSLKVVPRCAEHSKKIEWKWRKHIVNVAPDTLYLPSYIPCRGVAGLCTVYNRNFSIITGIRATGCQRSDHDGAQARRSGIFAAFRFVFAKSYALPIYSTSAVLISRFTLFFFHTFSLVA